MHYLATFTQVDNEHEHLDRVLVTAPNDKDARKLCDKECYQLLDEALNSRFSYLDGETSVTAYSLKNISAEHYEVLKEYLGEL